MSTTTPADDLVTEEMVEAALLEFEDLEMPVGAKTALRNAIRLVAPWIAERALEARERERRLWDERWNPARE